MNDEMVGSPGGDDSVADEPFSCSREAAGDTPYGLIPGIDPAEVWEAFAQIDAGQGVPHAEVFARLRGRASTSTRGFTPGYGVTALRASIRGLSGGLKA